jgi:hypothetical protein
LRGGEGSGGEGRGGSEKRLIDMQMKTDDNER